jgi:hypothetical protein
MATYLCRPKANVSNDGWTINVSTSLWEALVSEDDAGSWVAATRNGKTLHVLLDKPLVGACQSSLMYIRAREADGSGATVTYGTSRAGTFLDTGTYTPSGLWGQTSFSLTPDPADVNATNFAAGLLTDGTNPQDMRVSWVRLDLVYTEPTADGWAYLIGSFLGPLVAVGLHEMPGLIRRVNELARSVPIGHPWSPHRLHEDEAQAYWRSLKEWRRPVYAF